MLLVKMPDKTDMGSPLQEKSKVFALQMKKVCKEVKQKKRESVLPNQHLHSGTGVGANIREAFCTHGVFWTEYR